MVLVRAFSNNQWHVSQEAAALQRGIVAGITASGQLAIDPSLHYMLLSNLGRSPSLRTAFIVFDIDGKHCLLMQHTDSSGDTGVLSQPIWMPSP